jgi:hypothetical protein
MNDTEKRALKLLVNKYGVVGVMDGILGICREEGARTDQRSNYRLVWQQAGYATEQAIGTYRRRQGEYQDDPDLRIEAVEVENSVQARALLATYRTEGLEFADEQALMQWIFVRIREGHPVWSKVLTADEWGRMQQLYKRGSIT